MARTTPRSTANPADSVEQVDSPDELTAAMEVGFTTIPRTPVGPALLAARREFLAANGRFLTQEELEREIAERRCGSYSDDVE